MRLKGEAAELLNCETWLIKRQSKCTVREIVLRIIIDYAEGYQDLEERETDAHLTALYTLQDNGKTKGVNCTMNNGFPALMTQDGASVSFQVEILHGVGNEHNCVALSDAQNRLNSY